MTNYSILVVDDKPGETEILYNRLFIDDNRFKHEQVKTPKEFNKANIASYDAILLDINLDDWNLNLSDVLEIINNRCPVILASQRWPDEVTHKRVSETLSGAKDVNLIATLVLDWLGMDGWEGYAKSMRIQLSDTIGRVRRKGFMDLTDSDSVCILHLSDPQYKDPGTDVWSSYVEDIISQFVLRDLAKEVHFIAITGDIAYSGEIKQYDEAKIKLEKMFEKFFPNRSDWRERILLVPGNHDVNLKLACADKIGITFAKDRLDKKESTNTSLEISTTEPAEPNFPYRKFALAPFREFAWKLTGDPNWRDSEELNWINDSFYHIGLRFFLFNSTSTINCDCPYKAGYLDESIKGLGGEDLIHEQPFGIAFSHHGPPESDDMAEDKLEDFPKLASFLKTRNVKLFIHGHGHSRKVDLFDFDEQTTNDVKKGVPNDSELIRVMAPTTHLNGKLRPKNETRGFNLITLNRNHGRVTKVKVESYETIKTKLQPSKGSPWEYQISS